MGPEVVHDLCVVKMAWPIARDVIRRPPYLQQAY